MHQLVLILVVVTTVQGFTRLIGGNDAEIRNHNYLVSVEYFRSHRWGGALLKPNVVVTQAAFLSSTDKRVLSVRAGSSIAGAGGYVQTVLEVHIHPRFNEIFRPCNVAVLILKGSFPTVQEIGIIKLAPSALQIAGSTLGTVSGWGGTKSGELVSKRLQSVKVPHVSWDSCKEKQIILDKTLSCWGYLDGKKDVCSGDAGNPVVIHEGTASKLLVALVSLDAHCGQGPFPRMYTDVTNSLIHSFITQYI